MDLYSVRLGRSHEQSATKCIRRSLHHHFMHSMIAEEQRELIWREGGKGDFCTLHPKHLHLQGGGGWNWESITVCSARRSPMARLSRLSTGWRRRGCFCYDSTHHTCNCKNLPMVSTKPPARGASCEMQPHRRNLTHFASICCRCIVQNFPPKSDCPRSPSQCRYWSLPIRGSSFYITTSSLRQWLLRSSLITSLAGLRSTTSLSPTYSLTVIKDGSIPHTCALFLAIFMRSEWYFWSSPAVSALSPKRCDLRHSQTWGKDVRHPSRPHTPTTTTSNNPYWYIKLTVLSPRSRDVQQENNRLLLLPPSFFSSFFRSSPLFFYFSLSCHYCCSRRFPLGIGREFWALLLLLLLLNVCVLMHHAVARPLFRQPRHRRGHRGRRRLCGVRPPTPTPSSTAWCPSSCRRLRCWESVRPPPPPPARASPRLRRRREEPSKGGERLLLFSLSLSLSLSVVWFLLLSSSTCT